jgi:hypothetical protein
MREWPNNNRKRSRRCAKSSIKKKINHARARRHSFSVYSGQDWLGNVEQRGDLFTTKTIPGRKIGSFDSMKAAADAVRATAEAA